MRRMRFSGCRLAIAGTLVSSDNGDGSFTWQITAYYAP
jgi:hypothetical protein